MKIVRIVRRFIYVSFDFLEDAESKQREKKGFGKDRKSKLRKFDGSFNNFSMVDQELVELFPPKTLG